MTTVVLDDKHLGYIRTLTHILSLERKQRVTLTGLIREAVEKTFPMPTNKREENL